MKGYTKPEAEHIDFAAEVIADVHMDGTSGSGDNEEI